jgi:hypothetical protein
MVDLGIGAGTSFRAYELGSREVLVCLVAEDLPGMNVGKQSRPFKMGDGSSGRRERRESARAAKKSDLSVQYYVCDEYRVDVGYNH